MGRTEKDITTANAALHELAQWLRDQRRSAGLNYRQLAERAGLHATTLQRVASGSSVPPRQSVLAYARGCDALAEEALRLWIRARQEHIRSHGRRGRQPAPSPALVRDFADLSAAMREQYENAGGPPLRVMEERAGGFGALPRSSAHRMVNKQAVPHCLDQFRAFLRACEVPEDDWKAWEDAWSRAWRFEKEGEAGLPEVAGGHQGIWSKSPTPPVPRRADWPATTVRGLDYKTAMTVRRGRPLRAYRRVVEHTEPLFTLEEEKAPGTAAAISA
ncbi:helix-turn-helix domain-containing protein [Streptomyces sp. NPDC021212]|uniref:helix-turn-helix domain-containing protein n=1 Tax=Streptomyces sp. NPDC021212 TaxID=3365118 RepID=UPI0037A864FD